MSLSHLEEEEAKRDARKHKKSLEKKRRKFVDNMTYIY